MMCNRWFLAAAAVLILNGAACADARIGATADPRFEKDAPIPSGVKVGAGPADVLPEIYPTEVVNHEDEWQVVIDGKMHRTGAAIGDWRIMAIAPGVLDVQAGLVSWKLPVPRVR